MYRNLTHRLSLDEEPAVRLLRACGTDEAILRDGSEYDRFCALAAAMPLCAGHGLVASMTRILQASTGCNLPLCPHTAPILWERWADIHWYGRSLEPMDDPDPCPLCPPVEPTVLSSSEVTVLPDPGALAAAERISNLGAWSDRLAALLREGMSHALLRLPADGSFRCPDPYHAALALRAVTGGAATADDRALLSAQALRVLGEAAIAHGVTLLLVGGAPEAVLPLLAYLADCNRLPRTVWFPDRPADAALACGLYPQLGTGYRLTEDDDPAAKRSAYAASAPLGRAVILTGDCGALPHAPLKNLF